MKAWFLYSIVTFLLWGLWGFFGKLSGEYISEKSLVFLGTISFIFVIPLVWVIYPGVPLFEGKKLYYYIAIISGFFGGLGAIFFYAALKNGDSSRVVVITALYPMVTVILSYFILHERLSIYKILGVCCALAATVLLSL